MFVSVIECKNWSTPVSSSISAEELANDQALQKREKANAGKNKGYLLLTFQINVSAYLQYMKTVTCGASYPTAIQPAGLDSNDNFRDNPDWERFGYASGGTTYLLDQNGKLVVTGPGGQWLEFYIRKLLGLPVALTGDEKVK